MMCHQRTAEATPHFPSFLCATPAVVPSVSMWCCWQRLSNSLPCCAMLRWQAGAVRAAAVSAVRKITCAPLGDSPERLKELCVLLKCSQDQARPTLARREVVSSALHHWPVLSDASGLSFGWDAWSFKPTDEQAKIRCGCEGMSSDKHSERRKSCLLCPCSQCLLESGL